MIKGKEKEDVKREKVDEGTTKMRRRIVDERGGKR